MGVSGFALVSAALAGFAYGITPGPGVLAVLGIGADRGRRAGATFLAGHFAGDLLWYTLALVSIIGATSIDQTIFRLLGLASGLYLVYLGLRAVLSVGVSGTKDTDQGAAPFLYGLVFGATNPKSYPVAAAMFTALLAGQAQALTWHALPALLAFASLGSAAAYIVLVGLVGMRTFRAIYRRYELWLRRASGLMFIAFGGRSIADSIRG